jgi:glutathione S-transferase
MTQEQTVLWGRGSSTNVQKVIWACAELGLKPERRIVGGPHGGLDTPGMIAMNPNRAVPIWQEPGLVLWESQAILRHLARGGGQGRLYGRTEVEMARVDQWLDWFALVCWPPVRMIFLDVFRDGVHDFASPEVQSTQTRLETVLQIADAQVETHGYLAGPEFSLADIALAIGLNRLLGMPYDIAVPTGLVHWVGRLSKRPGFALALQDEPVMPGHPGIDLGQLRMRTLAGS